MTAKVGLAAAGIVAGAFLVMTVRYDGDFKTEQWRQATAYVAARTDPGDVVVFDSSVARMHSTTTGGARTSGRWSEAL